MAESREKSEVDKSKTHFLNRVQTVKSEIRAKFLNLRKDLDNQELRALEKVEKIEREILEKFERVSASLKEISQAREQVSAVLKSNETSKFLKKNLKMYDDEIKEIQKNSNIDSTIELVWKLEHLASICEVSSIVAPQDYTPSIPLYPVEDSLSTTLILDQVLGDVTEELMIDPQRVPNRFIGRFPSKSQRIESQSQLGEAPVHAIIIRNILKTQSFRKLQAYVENWWGDQIHSIKPTPDKNSSQHIILYINVYGEKLPDVIASKLREAEYVFHPMVIEIKYYTLLSGSAKAQVKPKCLKEISSENKLSPLLNPVPITPIKTKDPVAYLIITGVGNDVTIVEFENDTILKRYKDYYSDLRVQTCFNTGEKRIFVSFRNIDVIMEAESALLQSSFRGKKFDVRIEYIKPKGQTTSKQEHMPLPTLKGSPSNECKVVVRKIPPDTKEFEVFVLFNQYGNIIKGIELKRMNQTSTLLQCKIVFENSESAYRAARDQINCKGSILDVKLVSELIQIGSTEMEFIQTEEKATEQIPQATVSKNISAELMRFIRTKFRSHFDNFKLQGTVTYDEELGILTVTHPDHREFLRFEKDVLNEIDEVITNLDGEEMKLLNSPIQNYSSCIDMICGVLRDAKQIDYVMNHYPDQIHIFGDKLSVSVTVKKLREALTFTNHW